MAVTGGERLRRFIHEAKRHAGAEHVITVGYQNEGPEKIASLAALHEFGVSTANVRIPERPAFRRGIEEVKRGLHKQVIPLVKANRGYLTDDDVRKVGAWVHAEIVKSYMNFHGKPLSKLQEERKGHARQLIGAEGPRMIGHIGLWINGKRAD